MEALMGWLSPILVAFITGGLAYLGVSLTVKTAHEKTLMELKSEQEKQSLTIELQIEGVKKDVRRLEEKQDKHNQVIERTYKLEQRMDDMEKRIEK